MVAIQGFTHRVLEPKHYEGLWNAALSGKFEDYAIDEVTTDGGDARALQVANTISVVIVLAAQSM